MCTYSPDCKHPSVPVQKQFDDGAVQYWHPVSGPGLFRITVSLNGTTVDQMQGEAGKRTFSVIGSAKDAVDAADYLSHMQHNHDVRYKGWKVIHALTAYDRKQEGKRGYNMYALAMYCEASTKAEVAVHAGATWRDALVKNFCGRLLDIALKAVGETKSTDAEQRIA